MSHAQQQGPYKGKAVGTHVWHLFINLVIGATGSVVFGYRHFWVASCSFILLSAAVRATSSGGTLARSEEGVSLAQIAAAGISLPVFLVASDYTSHNWDVASAVIATTSLAVAVTLLTGPVLKAEISQLAVLLGVALLLAAVWFARLGISYFFDGWIQFGTLMVLVAVALGVLGVSRFLDSWILIGLAALLEAAAFGLIGISLLTHGSTSAGVMMLLLAFAVGLTGFLVAREGRIPVGVRILPVALTSVLVGIALLLGGQIWLGVATLLLAATIWLRMVFVFLGWQAPIRVVLPMLVLAIGLFGVYELLDDRIMSGIAVLLIAVSFGLGVESAFKPERVRAWLGSFWARFTERRPIYGDPNSEADGQGHLESSGSVLEPDSW